MENPAVVWDAVKEPYVKAWEEGRPGEAFGRGAFEVVCIVGGTKGADKLAKGSKLGGLATKADDVGKLANKADDAARLTSRAQKAQKAARAAEAPRTAEAARAAEAAKAAEAPPPVPPSKVNPGGGGGTPKGPKLDTLSVGRQEQHTYFGNPVHKKPGKSNKQNIENNRRADRLAKDANESKDLHTSLFNEKYSDPAMVSKIKDLAQAKIDAGDFIKLDKGGFQIKLNLNENVGWENQTPTKVIEVRISEKGVWHFFPTRG